MMMEVTILGRDNCHLCHVALRIARHVQVDISFDLRISDIAEDDRLLAVYGHRIPVVLIDQDERLAGKINERELRAALIKTRWSKSISRILSRFGFRPNRG
jgi:glutaredoxin